MEPVYDDIEGTNKNGVVPSEYFYFFFATRVSKSVSTGVPCGDVLRLFVVELTEVVLNGSHAVSK